VSKDMSCEHYVRTSSKHKATDATVPATLLPANGGSLHCKEQLVAYELADSLFEIQIISVICNTELVDYPIVLQHVDLISCHR
jgi:hypothetical protein